MTVLAPWTAQMISGADAVDWNGDGDLDDFVNGTLPIVTIMRDGAGAR